MRAEAQKLVDSIKEALGPPAEASLTGIPRQHRLAELNKRAEDPSLWSNPKAAQKVMRQRQPLERSINDYQAARARVSTTRVTLIELGEAEDDDATVAEGEAALTQARRRGAAARGRGAAVGRGRRQRHLSRGARRRRRHREPGLGLDAVAHVHALGRAARLQGDADRARAPAKRPASSRRRMRDQGRERLRLAEDGSRACIAWCASRPTTPTRAATRALRRVWVYPVVDDNIDIEINESDCRIDTYRVVRRRRPARQHDRLGGAHHAHPDRHRRRQPAGALAASRTAPSPGRC